MPNLRGLGKTLGEILRETAAGRKPTPEEEKAAEELFRRCFSRPPVARVLAVDDDFGEVREYGIFRGFDLSAPTPSYAVHVYGDSGDPRDDQIYRYLLIRDVVRAGWRVD